MAANVLQFPPPSDPYSNEIPVWMSFRAAYYSTFSRIRQKSAITSNAYLDITVPYPKALSTLNTQNYNVGGSLNVRALEIGGVKGVIESFKQEVVAKTELAQSFVTGGGVIRFDHLETILQPGARRTHSVVLDLVALNPAQSFIANEIALAFQTNVFPIANTSSILTMRHPPLWSINAFLGASFSTNRRMANYWDGQPLVSVLQSADINRAPINNIGYVTPEFRPLAINIKLLFVELEPAMQVGDGSANIFSRSDRLARR